MKKTGIIRRLDKLGRVVLPVELRRGLDWNEHDRVEILLEDERVVLQKYEPNCLFCGGTKNLKGFRGKLVCARCVEKMGEL